MNMRGANRLFSLAMAFFLAACAGSGACWAEEEFTRLGKWEAFGFVNYCEDDSVDAYRYAYWDLKFRGNIRTEVDPSFRIGAGLGRTVHDYLNLNGTFSYGQVKLLNWGSNKNSFTIPVTKEKVSNIKADTHEWTINLNADGYLFPDTFPGTSLHITPMITAGFGCKYFHGEWEVAGLKIRDYILTTNAGAGFRWDFSPFFVKALYHTTWYRMTDNEDSYQCMGYTGLFGYTF